MAFACAVIYFVVCDKRCCAVGANDVGLRPMMLPSANEVRLRRNGFDQSERKDGKVSRPFPFAPTAQHHLRAAQHHWRLAATSFVRSNTLRTTIHAHGPITSPAAPNSSRPTYIANSAISGCNPRLFPTIFGSAIWRVKVTTPARTSSPAPVRTFPEANDKALHGTSTAAAPNAGSRSRIEIRNATKNTRRFYGSKLGIFFKTITNLNS